MRRAYSQAFLMHSNRTCLAAWKVQLSDIDKAVYAIQTRNQTLLAQVNLSVHLMNRTAPVEWTDSFGNKITERITILDAVEACKSQPIADHVFHQFAESYHRTIASLNSSKIKHNLFSLPDISPHEQYNTLMILALRCHQCTEVIRRYLNEIDLEDIMQHFNVRLQFFLIDYPDASEDLKRLANALVDVTTGTRTFNSLTEEFHQIVKPFTGKYPLKKLIDIFEQMQILNAAQFLDSMKPAQRQVSLESFYTSPRP